MIVSRTPFRVSFFGGGTDYPDWFRDHGGAVLATGISHYCYINGRILPPFFDHKYRIIWSKIEKPSELNDIEHPVVREALRWMKVSCGMEIHHLGDLPARSGLGTSSSFAVGILHMLHALKGELVSMKQLALEAINLEQVLLQESVGVQDQIIAAYGGFNKVVIFPDGDFRVEPLPLSEGKINELESRILMFYTGVSRTASNIAKNQIENIKRKTNDLHEMRKLVDIAEKLLCDGNGLDDVGRLLHETWELKRGLSAFIAPDYVNDIYAKGLKAGALGGKVLGAGGGGFIMFYVQPEKRQAVLDALSDLLRVPFKVDYSGSMIMYRDKKPYSQAVNPCPSIP